MWWITASCLLAKGICSHLKATRTLVDVWQASETSHSKAARATFSINTGWIVSQRVQLLFDGEKCVLLLCAWKLAFLRSGHICKSNINYSISPPSQWASRTFQPYFGSYAIKTIQQRHSDWDQQLLKLMFVYRTAIHETTGYTPFHVTFGHSPLLPFTTSFLCMKCAFNSMQVSHKIHAIFIFGHIWNVNVSYTKIFPLKFHSIFM